MDLQSIFNHLIDLAEPICQWIDKTNVSLLFDTSGIDAGVTNNNPKYASPTIIQLKISKELGVVRDIRPHSKNFLNAQPDIVVEKKIDSPLNANSISSCSKDPSLPTKQEENEFHLRCALPTIKLV